ncbi:MAG: hypothetical protein K0S08_1414 [Gammaproteobacteria bacterium]|jgi:hypothetical protein|nr:hypothetical protein [Gammaproteobacteria bacterium]
MLTYLNHHLLYAALLRIWEGLYQQTIEKNKRFYVDPAGVSLNFLKHHRWHYCHLLAEELSSKSYQTSPAKRCHYKIRNKTRTFFHLQLADILLQRLWFELLMPRLEKYLSPHLFSYRKGRCIIEAIKSCSAFIRKARKAKKDLYVFRADIKDFTDTIPVHFHSLIWQQLESLLPEMASDKAAHAYSWELLQQLTRPAILQEDGTLYQNLYGLPTGTVFSNMLGNLYLTPLDQCLASIEGGFYLRYGDDFLFLHASADRVLEASQKTSEILTSLELTLNLKKQKFIYLTKAGKKDVDAPAFLGAQYFEFLGFNIYADATRAPKKGQTRKLMRYFRQLILVTAKLTLGESLEDRAYALCEALNQQARLFETGIESQSDLIALFHSTNRFYFKELDKQIALSIAETLTGKKGVDAFNLLPYRKLRNKYGLLSLCQIKNRKCKT